MAVPNDRSRMSREVPVLLAIGLIITLRFGFGMSYSVAVPPWEAYDEPGHFGYAARLAAYGLLPTETDDPINPERIQPPLYYLGLAAFLSISGSNMTGFRFPATNPYFYYERGQINYALHRRIESPEQTSLNRALFTGRFGSLLFSLLGIPFTYLASKKVWPGGGNLPIAASA